MMNREQLLNSRMEVWVRASAHRRGLLNMKIFPRVWTKNAPEVSVLQKGHKAFPGPLRGKRRPLLFIEGRLSRTRLTLGGEGGGRHSTCGKRGGIRKAAGGGLGSQGIQPRQSRGGESDQAVLGNRKSEGKKRWSSTGRLSGMYD